MALDIYFQPTPGNKHSANGKFTNPLTITLDSVKGGVRYEKLYIRNDNSKVDYIDISLSITNPGSLGVAAANTWKILAGDTLPHESLWSTISDANTVTFTNITDTNTYLPFWLRVEVAPNVSVQSITDVKLNISAEEVKHV